VPGLFIQPLPWLTPHCLIVKLINRYASITALGLRSLVDRSTWVSTKTIGNMSKKLTLLLMDLHGGGYFMNDEYVPNICRNTGLTKGTPEYGQCVLRLMDSVMSEED
jgi:hypothetical protein